MGRWLSRIENQEKAPSSIPTKPTKPGSVSSVSTPTGALLEAEGADKATPSRQDWLEWIADQVPLIPDDRRYVWSRLSSLPPQVMERIARRYVETWKEVADKALAEDSPRNRREWDELERKDSPWPVAAENAGRDAANRTLLALIRPDSWRWRREHRKP